MQQQHRDEKFRTAMWAVALGLIVILGVAQLDEHRRFRRDRSAALVVNQQRAEAELTRLQIELAGSQAYLDALRAYARDEEAFRRREEELRRTATPYSVLEAGTTQPATTTTATPTTAAPGQEVVLVRPVRPKPPVPSARAFTTPAPMPRFEDYQLVSRIRRGVCMSAFVACAALPLAWLLGGDSLRRHGGAVAEAMLVLALLGTGGMLLGWGYWRNWNVFAWDNNAAGWGLILIPLAVIATIIAGRREARAGEDGAG